LENRLHQDGFRERRFGEFRAVQGCIAEIGAGEIRLYRLGPAEIRARQFGARKVRAGQPGFLEVRAGQDRALQVGAFERQAVEGRFCEIRALAGRLVFEPPPVRFQGRTQLTAPLPFGGHSTSGGLAMW